MKKYIANKKGMASIYAMLLCWCVLLVALFCLQLVKTYQYARRVQASTDLDIIIFNKCREIDKASSSEETDRLDEELDLNSEENSNETKTDIYEIETGNNEIEILKNKNIYTASISGRIVYTMIVEFDPNTHVITKVSYL